MVLLHGMFADGTQWRVIADLLADYYRVIVVDLLGHGQSPKPGGAKYTAEEHARALRATLESLHATRDAHIVGYSMGGVVAVQYAAEYHDVAQLFMISTPFYLKPEEMVEAGYARSIVYTKFTLWLFGWLNRLLYPDKLLYRLVQKDKLMKTVQFLIDAYDNNLDPDIARLNLRNLIGNYPFAKALSRVTSPITFYCGKRDVFVVQPQLRALKRIQPLMQTEALGIVKNDHMLVQYLPQQVVKVLTRYHEQLLRVHSDHGEGKVFVLLHGIESSSRYWENVAERLSDKYRVVTIDLLGFGESPKPLNIAYSLDDHAEWLQRTLRSLNLRNFTLMGHSLGALVAMQYAARFPRAVNRLVLVAPVIIGSSPLHHRFFMRKFKYVEYFSDTGYLVSTIASAVGEKRMAKFTPTIRSVSNGVKVQDMTSAARRFSRMPLDIVYGDKDPLVDKHQLAAFTTHLPLAHTHVVHGAGHNFALNQPTTLLGIVDANMSSTQVKKTYARPNVILRQLIKLAAPILLVKGMLYTLVGVLLFSPFKEETLVCGVAIVVMIQGAQFIRGSFSLKNEGLSYLSYLALGVAGVLFGYLLATRFDFTLRVALTVVLGLVLLAGLARLIAAFAWTNNRRLKRKLVLSGFILSLLAVAAFLGSTVSVHIVVYALAIYLIARGVTYLFYLGVSAVTAYSRSF